MKEFRIFCLAAMAFAAMIWAGAMATGAPRAIQSNPLRMALADPGRAGDLATDARRHPAELVTLAELKPGQRVLDLIPGNGYWTRIFSKMVGPKGRVYAVWPEAYGKLAKTNVAQLQAMSASAAYANVTTIVQPSTDLSAPEALDMIWTSQNYHDYADPFMGSPGPDKLMRAAYRMLKPGGLFVIIDHASAAGRGLSDTDRLHRIDPQTVRAQAQAAGFVFAGESRVLRNAADPLNVPVFDKSIRGHTNQFAMKFRKPRQ